MPCEADSHGLGPESIESKPNCEGANLRFAQSRLTFGIDHFSRETLYFWIGLGGKTAFGRPRTPSHQLTMPATGQNHGESKVEVKKEVRRKEESQR